MLSPSLTRTFCSSVTNLGFCSTACSSGRLAPLRGRQFLCGAIFPWDFWFGHMRISQRAKQFSGAKLNQSKMLTKKENYPTLSLLELQRPLHNRSCFPPPLGQSAILQQIFHFMSKYIECKLCLFSSFCCSSLNLQSCVSSLITRETRSACATTPSLCWVERMWSPMKAISRGLCKCENTQRNALVQPEQLWLMTRNFAFLLNSSFRPCFN